ncbi:MAG: HU family DNA-binding protein [Bacteroides sp.]|nr:HU family DNA-binding protein [Eubacterium sp.]MCM1418167.1 HU family DNA-binding protein [Roseburia sp.]MCM1462308.1 HU family DNA-binding protein [Bacteroides sp.]
MTLNKKEFAAVVAEKANCTKQHAEEMVDCIMGAITDTLAGGDEVKLIGFGTFGTRIANARNGINPLNGETISIPSKVKPFFKAGKTLKDSLN